MGGGAIEDQSNRGMALMPAIDASRAEPTMKLSAIDTNLLLALHALLEESSVTRAAKRLGTGQPAMSRSLARLREHFKDPLLVQRGRQLVLSPGAQALAPSVAKAIAAVTEVFVEGSAPRSSRAYVVACADLFGAAIIPGLLDRLARASSAALEVRAIPARSTEQILDDGADVVMGSFEDVPATLTQRHLFSDPFACVVRANHPRVDRAISLRTYLELPHLEVLPAPNAQPGLRIERALGTRAAQRRVVLRVPYFSLAARVLAESDLVLTMTRSFARELQRFAPLEIVDAPIKLPPLRFSLVWNRGRDIDRAHEWFRDLVANVCLERLGGVTL
jgi:DNA-binding transcriptional LysR family regulator